MSKEFLGRGWAFPVALNEGGNIEYSAEEKKIRESVLLILGTARGERVMRPEFGSRLHELVFASVTASTKALAASYVTRALVQWEPRIDVLRVTAEEDRAVRSGTLLIDVQYRVRSTNSIFNLVYPFYAKAGRS